MKKHKQPEDERQWKHVAEAIHVEAEELAQSIALNERSMHLLRRENEEMRIKLTEIMICYRIPFLNINLVIKRDLIEKFSLELITKRGTMPVEETAKAFVNRCLKKYIEDVPLRKKAAKKIAKGLAEILRVDAFLVTKLRGVKWADKFVNEKDTKPFVRVNEGHKTNA